MPPAVPPRTAAAPTAPLRLPSPPSSPLHQNPFTGSIDNFSSDHFLCDCERSLFATLRAQIDSAARVDGATHGLADFGDPKAAGHDPISQHAAAQVIQKSFKMRDSPAVNIADRLKGAAAAWRQRSAERVKTATAMKTPPRAVGRGRSRERVIDLERRMSRGGEVPPSPDARTHQLDWIERSVTRASMTDRSDGSPSSKASKEESPDESLA